MDVCTGTALQYVYVYIYMCVYIHTHALKTVCACTLCSQRLSSWHESSSVALPKSAGWHCQSLTETGACTRVAGLLERATSSAQVQEVTLQVASCSLITVGCWSSLLPLFRSLICAEQSKWLELQSHLSPQRL